MKSLIFLASILMLPALSAPSAMAMHVKCKVRETISNHPELMKEYLIDHAETTHQVVNNAFEFTATAGPTEVFATIYPNSIQVELVDLKSGVTSLAFIHTGEVSIGNGTSNFIVEVCVELN